MHLLPRRLQLSPHPHFSRVRNSVRDEEASVCPDELLNVGVEPRRKVDNVCIPEDPFVKHAVPGASARSADASAMQVEEHGDAHRLQDAHQQQIPVKGSPHRDEGEVNEMRSVEETLGA